MLKFGNKEFRNLQEQVKKNMDDILFILQEEGVLNEFGIKVVGQEATSANMPTVADYKEDNPDWSYGDAYAVGTEDPYTLYILTRANGTHPNDYWFNIGRFPVAGPQGPQGPQGDVGPQGPTGPTGANGLSAGFGTVSGTAETVSYGSDATVQITTSGPDTAKNIQFTFGIPEGRPGKDGASEWGEITGSLENQTDLFTALQAKQNTLVSGTNIKTINSESVLGSGNIAVQPTLVSGTNIKTINNESILGSGNIDIQGGQGDVTDVQVNGVSVVDQDGVAEITVPTKTSDLTNDSGFITSSALSGYATESWVGQQGFITGITSSDVTTALGYTPGTSNFSGAYADLTGKPTIPTATSELTNDSGFITSSALTGYATENYVQGYHDSTKQDVISDLATIRSGAALGATAVQPAAISDMATQTWVGNQGYLTGITSSDVTTALGYVPGTSNFSGAYADLTGKPDLSIYAETSDLGACAFLDENELSIAYSQITGTPTIPSKTSDLTNDSGFITSSALSEYVTLTGAQNVVSDKTLRISTGAQYLISSPQGDAISLYAGTGNDDGEVALSSHGDLSLESESNIILSTASGIVIDNTPLKTTDLGSYGLVLPNTLNFTANKTIATTDQIPTIPTATSDLTNDSGFITSSDIPVTDVTLGGTSVLSSGVAALPAYPTVPTTVSSFTNDAGYQTASDVSTAIAGKLDATMCTYQTTEPTAAATDGGVHIVYLSAEPTTKYAGYIYMIAEN